MLKTVIMVLTIVVSELPDQAAEAAIHATRAASQNCGTMRRVDLRRRSRMKNNSPSQIATRTDCV